MKALITGASSGIGKDMAIILSKMGYDLILVARREDKLQKLSRQLMTKCCIIPMDLGEDNACKKLYDMVQDEDIDILINNAGFGYYGNFVDIDLATELDMININIRALHELTKLFLQDFVKKDKGYILNVASSAGFMAGPKMATYYATKNYVVRLTQGLYEELRRAKSNVYVGTLCPGPVATEFNDVANVKFAFKGLSSVYVADYAIKKMFKRKLIIIPGLIMKLSIFFTRFAPIKVLLKIGYNIQNKKG